MALANPHARWPSIARDQCMAAFLLGGLALLLTEVRFEHREVLAETWRSWIPLAYSASTLLLGGAALLRWREGGRRVLSAFFSVGIMVGLVGFWFHTDGHPIDGMLDVLGAWRIPLGRDGGIRIGSRPPALAPLAFCGLGTLGLLVCTVPNAQGTDLADASLQNGARDSGGGGISRAVRGGMRPRRLNPDAER
jgi:hypothetical protein